MTSCVLFSQSAGGRGLQIFALALFFGVLAVFVAIMGRSRRRPLRLGAVFLLLAGFSFLCLLLDLGYAPDYLPPREFPAALRALAALPWPWYAAVLAGEALAMVLLLLALAGEERRTVLPAAVKEAVDRLPAGICFGRADGAVVLANLRMTRWCRLITGGALSDYDTFRGAVWSKGQAQNGSVFLRLPDETALRFEETTVTVDGVDYRQLTAADITEQYRVTEELARKNARLRDIQIRMKAWAVEASGLATSREILTARTTVHDEVGHVLLRARHYFEHPEAAETRTLLALTRRTNELLLREAEEPDDAGRDELADALALARGIGVTTEMIGTPPEAGEARALLARALRECAMNARKHAGADRVTLTLSEKDNVLTAVFENNGTPPAGDIIETGGLKALRRAVEDAGGRMSAAAGERFSVTLFLPV